MFLPTESPKSDSFVLLDNTDGEKEQLSCFFDLMMKDQIQQNIVPALNYLIKVFFGGRTTKGGSWIVFTATILIQRYYLTRYNALISEYLCGMKRMRIQPDGTVAPLQARDRMQLLALMVTIVLICFLNLM